MRFRVGDPAGMDRGVMGKFHCRCREAVGQAEPSRSGHRKVQ